jgi:hypothetical protein
VNLRDVQERRASFPEIADLLAVVAGCSSKNFHRLGQRFMAFRQPVKSFINRHFLAPAKWLAEQILNTSAYFIKAWPSAERFLRFSVRRALCRALYNPRHALFEIPRGP